MEKVLLESPQRRLPVILTVEFVPAKVNLPIETGDYI